MTILSTLKIYFPKLLLSKNLNPIKYLNLYIAIQYFSNLLTSDLFINIITILQKILQWKLVNKYTPIFITTLMKIYMFINISRKVCHTPLIGFFVLSLNSFSGMQKWTNQNYFEIFILGMLSIPLYSSLLPTPFY